MPILSVASFNLGIFDLFTLFFLIFSLKDCYFVTNWTWLSITVEISWPTTNVLWQNLAIYNQSLVWKSTSVLNMDNTAYTYRSKGMIFADVSSNVFVFVILGLFLLKTSMRTKSNVAMGLRKSLNKCASMLLLNWGLTAEKCLGISDSLRFLSIRGKQCYSRVSAWKLFKRRARSPILLILLGNEMPFHGQIWAGDTRYSSWWSLTYLLRNIMLLTLRRTKWLRDLTNGTWRRSKCLVLQVQADVRPNT